MDRRSFLKLSGAGALGLPLLAACEAGTSGLTQAEPDPADAGATEPPPDAHVLEPLQDAGLSPDVSIIQPPPYVVRERFTVRLVDTSCSRHDHAVSVEPGEYADDTPIHYLAPSSHEVAFRPSELMQLEQGVGLPFATIGPGPGHGHCGTAWRDSALPRERPEQACAIQPVADCEP